MVSSNWPSIRQHPYDRIARRQRDRDVDPAPAVGTCTRAGQDQARAGSTVADSALAALVRITGPHKILAR